ncbi:MAG: hypothetical protein J7K40_08830 [candidate division Zixibacteria bacterium]|nr:hypothetical protein [candidate division Zixibacteria bacterium]
MKLMTVILILIPVLCFGSTNLTYDSAGKTAAEVTLSNDMKTSICFSLSGLTLEPVDIAGKEFSKILPVQSELSDFGFTHQEGLPNIPVYSDFVIIPDRSGVRVNIISSEFETYQNINAMPSQPFALESGEQEMSFVFNESFYQKDAFYPEQLVELSEPMIMRDFRFVQTNINPVQYNPATKEMRVYTSVEYELIYEGVDERNLKVRNNYNISEAFLPIYESVFSNADLILSDYEVVRGGYLIITPNNMSFADTIAALARWKHLKGYPTRIVESDEITPTGSPTYTQVRNFIVGAYQNWDLPPEYILIVGDEDQRIPDYPYSGYTSDHQYTTIDGSDYVSDIFLARMSVDNMTELRTAMYKVLRYEQEPDMSDPGYYKRGLGVAGNIYATSPRITNLWVRKLALEHGYTQVDTVFDWGSGAPNWSTINTAINNGVSYVSYRGWAGSSGWYNPNYTVSNINGLSNGWKTGIMASIVCGTGNFGSNICFGEAWIRAGSPTFPKGGPCFYGTTDGSTHTAWNNPNMVGFFSALFDKGMYNFAQLMFMGKWRIFEAYPSLNSPGSYIQKYFNTYNSLGDPQLEVRTEIPMTMTVSYPANIPVGTNFLTIHVADNSFPLEGAYVNLVKGYGINEEIYAGGWTDNEGNVIIHFTNTSADTIFVTATARDYIPHMGHCLSISQTVALGTDSLIIDDSDAGGTNGNNDGKANPGETLGLDIRLKNFGTSVNATGINASLTSDNPAVSIITGDQTYPNINHGQSALPDGLFIVELDQDIPHGETILLNLAVTSNEGDWEAVVVLDINSIKPVSVEVSYPGNPNNRIDPGETSNIVLSFTNVGGLDGEQITGALSCEDNYVTINNATGQFGDIDINQSGDNSSTPFNISVNTGAFNGRNINFTVAFTSDMSDMDDVLFEKTFSIVIGSISSYDPIGPDNYGYYMYDNTDMGFSEAPIYDWIEINPQYGGSGTRITMPNNDDASTIVSLPFDFKYYGEITRKIIVSTNGFIALDTLPYDRAGSYWHNWDNWPIPDPGNACGQISPFWDDMESSGSINGIYKYHDTANGMFIIEWSGFIHSRTGSPETFQIIIYDALMHPTPTGDCEIVFQYNVINNDDNNNSSSHPEAYSSVGFENWDEDDGLEYQYDNVYHPGAAILQDGLAIKITTAVSGLAAPPDMDYSPESFDLACQPGEIVETELIIENNGAGYLLYAIAPEMIDNLFISGTKPAEIAHQAEPAPAPAVLESKSDVFNGPYNPPVVLDSGGPDNFGYTWIDSDEPGGPVYNWIDISSIGTPITGLGDESMVGPYSIGFAFSYYGNDCNSFWVNSNGYAAFSNTSTTYNNGTIPNTSTPNDILAVYWDDMNFSSGGNAYRYNNGVDTCIISYVGVPHYSNDGSFTFEIILLRSGKIIFQYQEATGSNVNEETIGIENATGNDGLQVCYNAAYVQPGLAIEFSSAIRWLSVNPTSNTLEPYSVDTIAITCDASDLEENIYEGILHITTNDIDYPSLDLPLIFNVFIPGVCDYVPGDFNGDGDVTEADATYGMRFFRDIGANPPDSCWNDAVNAWLYAAADVNGSCEVLGSDISYLISYFRSINSELLWCPQTPPPDRLRSGKDVIRKSRTIKGSSR